MDKKQTKAFSIRMSNIERLAIEDISASWGMSLSASIRRLIREYKTGEIKPMNDQLTLIANILNNAGFIAQIIGNQVLVSLQNQSVSSIDVQKVLMRDDIDELVSIQYSYAFQCVTVSI